MMKKEADENEVKREIFSEGHKVPSTEELKSLISWSHRHGQILKAARLTHLVPAGSDDLPDEEKERFDKIKEKDLIIEELFRLDSEDIPAVGFKQNWLSKVAGDPQPFAQAPPKDGSTSYAINVIKNLRWPRQTTVQHNGYGMKRGDVCFNPTEPLEVQKDPLDQMEQQDRTLLQAPKAPVVNLNIEQVPPEDE